MLSSATSTPKGISDQIDLDERTLSPTVVPWREGGLFAHSLRHVLHQKPFQDVARSRSVFVRVAPETQGNIVLDGEWTTYLLRNQCAGSVVR